MAAESGGMGGLSRCDCGAVRPAQGHSGAQSELERGGGRSDRGRSAAHFSPVSLGIYDPLDGKQVVIAQVKDCQAERGAASNEIVFRNCFDRIRGSIRFLYTR